MDKPTFNYNKLRGRIIEKYGSQKAFSEALHISQAALTSRLSGATYFTQSEISKANELLGIDSADISDYFFVLKV